MNTVTLIPLTLLDLSLLYHWLNTPHVKAFWDTHVDVTPTWIEEKYGSYVEGWKEENGQRLPLHAFTLAVNGVKVGYLQAYDAYYFPRDGYDLKKALSQEYGNIRLAAVDLFIGKAEWVGKGIGPKALEVAGKWLKKRGFQACLVDPESANTQAIRAYEKAGFKKISQLSLPESSLILMIKEL